MSNTQYAVCHLQRGSGNDSGMSCHIERKDANGKKYIPVNADANRTQLNRELIAFPAGVKNRTDAIQFRIIHAGLHRKVGKNQCKAIRIILTGTHEQMMKIQDSGRMPISNGCVRHSGRTTLCRVSCTWTRRHRTCTLLSYPLSPPNAFERNAKARKSTRLNPDRGFLPMT